MEFSDKLDLLGGGASDDIACNTCASNPNASVVSHRATEPISHHSISPRREFAASDIQPRPKDLKPWLSSAIQSNGKRIPIIKTLMTSACEKDCYYCPTRRGRNSLRRVTFKPDELAEGFDQIQRRGLAEGIFLSSGIIGGGTRTMEKTIAAIEILRHKYEFRGYVHLKIMPGAERAAIERALQLADRVSVNLEAPNSERLAKLSGTKAFFDELLAPLKVARELMENDPRLKRSMVTQFVVGGADESDREILSTTAKLYRQLRLSRIYFSAFHPVIDTPLENHAPTPLIREHRLYQTDFLLRQYGFTYADLVFDEAGNLPTQIDPKTMYAVKHPELFPLEVNRASREELLRVPGIGPKTADRILQLRRTQRVNAIQELRRIGADAGRAAPFILLSGKQPTRQLPLFSNELAFA